MYRELPYVSWYATQLETAHPVPSSSDRRWRGHTQQCKAALQQLAGVAPNPQLWLKRKACHVTGADCWRYYQRPLTPFAHRLCPHEILPLPEEDDFPSEQPTHYTVGVQTDFRESETQTDPYSPDVAEPTTPSELLQLATLTWGRGLPAGLVEVEIIQFTRAKRAWEAALPSLDDPSQLDKRRRMMEAIEVKEWAFREGQLKRLHEFRLAVLRDILRKRAEAQNEARNEKLNQIYFKLQKNRETRLQKIDNNYARSLRKLEAKGRKTLGMIERLGVVKDRMDYQTRAPRSLRDSFTHRNTYNDELKSYYLDTCEGLLQLEASVLKPWVKKPKPKVIIIKTVIKPSSSRVVELMKKYKALDEKNKQEAEEAARLIKKPVPRPVTPRVEEPPEGDEEIELAVIHLQKLMRGRSIQYKMLNGKENHLELIQEQRTVHALQREEQGQQRADKGLVMTLKKQREEQRHKVSQEEASKARVVGEELQHLFDTLSKTLIHLQEERMIRAFTMLAERDRRLREAEESGRRQVEERRRKEEDEIFRQVVQVHQDTVDLYLEDIILGTVEQTSDQQAREEIHRRAKEVNDIAYAMEESRNNLQSEEIVSELVYSFLIPEVEKITVRQRVNQRQRRHLQAARSIIQGTAEQSGLPPSILAVPQMTCPSERASSRVLEEMLSPVEQEKGRKTTHSR